MKKNGKFGNINIIKVIVKKIIIVLKFVSFFSRNKKMNGKQIKTIVLVANDKPKKIDDKYKLSL